MTVKIGLIGLGMIGRDHLKRFHNVISGAQVTAVCDINQATADAVASEYSATPFYDATNVIMLILLIKYLPETRGLTLEQIEKKFRF